MHNIKLLMVIYYRVSVGKVKKIISYIQHQLLQSQSGQFTTSNSIPRSIQ